MEKILTLKTSTVSISLVSMFVYLWIDHKVFWLYTILLFIDFLTWVIKWWRQKNLSSAKAINGFLGKFLMLLVIFSFWVFGKINDYDMSYILSWTFFALSLAELYSIISNVYEIRTGNKVKEYDAVAIILQYVLWWIKERLEYFLKGKDESRAKD